MDRQIAPPMAIRQRLGPIYRTPGTPGSDKNLEKNAKNSYTERPPSSHPTLCEDAKKAPGPGADPMVSVPCCQLTTSHTDQKTCLTLPISRIAMQGKGAKKP